MKRKHGNRNTMMVTIISSIVVAVVLIAGTFWTGRAASLGTEEAVRNVSFLYLDELAGRREQVVSSTLSDYINVIDVALHLITKDDLSSVENLQSYQYRMKQLYGLEKFAFVDEKGLIYTSRGTRTDIDLYDFDPNTISEPEISVRKDDGNTKKVIIAVPTDRLPFEGEHLVACFMEIDMEHMLETLSFQSGTDNITFCNIYSSDGRSLTNMVLGGLSSDDNLLTALESAALEPGYDLGKMREDFSEGRSGVICFTYNDIRETMHYVPVHKTDWMLTYLIRESVISERIDSISHGIVARSFIMSILTAFVLAIAFVIIFIQSRKASKLAVERETAEMMQQELEERIALQDELLEQEKKRAQQDSMITALASDYRSVYYVNLDTDVAICYRNDGSFADFPSIGTINYLSSFTDYGNSFVTEEYRSAFLEFIAPKNIREKLSREKVITLRYLTEKNGKETYEMLRMAGVGASEGDDSNTIHAVGVGFTDIDAEMRESLANNQALSDALKTAEEASKAKTTFLSNMSHEIRTPMNAIIGLDALALNDESISDSTRDYLTKINSSAQHLLSLINDILDMSRIESGRMTLKSEEFEFSELIEQINIIFGEQCNEKKINYESHVDNGVNDYYFGDCTKLRQILINILGNSVKFTPEGGSVSLSVECTGHYDGRSTLMFTMSDTGIGMSEDYLPRIYDTFSQEANDEISNKYGSTGLGLAITRNLVEMMNGKIDVKSKKGEGTTFFVTVTLEDSDKKRTDRSAGKEEDAKKKNLSGRHVLLAEDMEINAEIMVKILKMREIETDHAINGKEAVELFETHPEGYYDAILMDMRMDEMDGITATTIIRQMERADASSIPIIALTANAFDEDVQRSLQAGLNAHLCKPVEPELLFETLEKLIK